MPPFNKALNYELSEKRTNVGVSMEEVLNDVVNAAGIGAIHVGYAARFVDKEVPVKDAYKNLPDEVLQQAKAAGLVEMQTVPQVVSYKFFTSRISPVDMLWPSDFTGSNFDDGDFIGIHWRHSHLGCCCFYFAVVFCLQLWRCANFSNSN